MIIDAEAHVGEVLNDQSIKTALNDNIFWELIPVRSNKNSQQDLVKLPYMMYHLESDGNVSKDRLTAYNVTMWIFDQTITGAAQIAKIIDDAIRASKYRWYCLSEKSGYVDSEAKEGYIELIYNFKI